MRSWLRRVEALLPFLPSNGVWMVQDAKAHLTSEVAELDALSRAAFAAGREDRWRELCERAAGIRRALDVLDGVAR